MSQKVGVVARMYRRRLEVEAFFPGFCLWCFLASRAPAPQPAEIASDEEQRFFLFVSAYWERKSFSPAENVCKKKE